MLTMAERFMKTSICVSDIGIAGGWTLDVGNVVHDIGSLGCNKDIEEYE
jgi:hypothetical protein